MTQDADNVTTLKTEPLNLRALGDSILCVT